MAISKVSVTKEDISQCEFEFKVCGPKDIPFGVMSRYEEESGVVWVNSLGEGGVSIVQENGLSMKAGDYLVPSGSKPGYACRAASQDAIPKNVVGKVLCDVSYASYPAQLDKKNVKHFVVPVQYLCG